MTSHLEIANKNTQKPSHIKKNIRKTKEKNRLMRKNFMWI